MNQPKIIVPTDFTATANTALEHAKNIAKKVDASIQLLHIKSDKDPKNAAELLQSNCDAVTSSAGVQCNYLIEGGDIVHDIGKICDRENAGIVVIGTHGIQGLAQHLFGAHIIKVVKNINYPTIVVQDNSPTTGGFNKILLPVIDVDNFEAMVKSILPIATWFQSEVMVYAINHPMSNLENMKRNIGVARSLFNKAGINYSETEEQPTMYSAGIAKQTLAFAESWGASLIVVSLSETEKKGNINLADCERIINNEAHRMVLCAPNAISAKGVFN